MKESDDGAPDEATASVGAAKPTQVAGPRSLAPLRRADILQAVAAAADATASGRPLPAANQQLMDRSFELHLPFGCEGTSVGTWGDVQVEPAREVLRVTVKPQRWTVDSLVGQVAQGQSFDAIEGFWVERPWAMAETCPTVPVAPSDASAPLTTPPSNSPPFVKIPPSDTPALAASGEQTVALAQFFAPETSRTLQRKNRPYTFTGKIPQNHAETRGVFRLMLTGRVVGFGDGQPVHCTPSDPAKAPLCVVGVEFTGVAIENSQSGEILATWK